MSPRFFSSVFLCLALGWALHANRADAQPAAPPTAADKMLRVTYPVADLVVPIPGRAKAETREAIAANLIQLITKTIAPHSWEKPGAGTIQYFPMGMAIVVYQPQSVHEEITALLAALRRVVDEQVSIEMRLVTASPAMAKHLLLDMDEHGRVVRAVRDANATAHRFVSMDDKQIATFLTLAQSYQSTTILQTPKITLFNAQHARLSQTTPTFGDEAVPSSNSFTCALLPVLDAKREFVRLTLELQYQSAIDKGAQAIAANRTFVVAPGRTLVWHLGETVERRHLFVLATPRVVIDEPEERLFIGEIPLTPGRDEKPPMADPERRIDAMIARQIVKDGFLFLSANEPQKAKFLALKAKELNVRFAPGETTPDDLLREIERRANAGAEEQTIPDRQAPPRIHPKKAIEKRLRQPISLHFKNVPLQQAFKDLSSASGVAIRLDLRSLQDAKIDLDAPISLAVDDISMKSALNIMLDRLRLTYSVQDDGILISTEDKVRYYRVTYDVRDLIESAERVNHFSKKGDNVGETLMGLVQTSVARNTWEAQGGPGSVSYLPNQKALVVQQSSEAHDDVAMLLASLRRLYDISVEVEMGLVQVTPKTAKELRKAMAKAGAKGRSMVTMDEGQLEEIERIVQGDLAGQVTRAPRITLLNGENGVVGPLEKAAFGLRFEIQPVAAPDRRSVRLALRIEYQTTDESRFVEQITRGQRQAAVPEGQSLVWDLGETSNRQHLFIVVRPRIRESATPKEPELQPIPGR